MTCKLVFRPSFERSIKHLKKRYRNVAADLVVAFASIDADPTVGAVIPRDYAVRKLRVASRDMRRGKSGGFRLLYFLHDTQEELRAYILLLYAKSEREDVSFSELAALIKDI